MLPVDIVFGSSKERFESKNRFVSQQRDYMDRAFQKVRGHTKMEQRWQKYFLFDFEGRIWDLIVSVRDHCLSFNLLRPEGHPSNQKSKYCSGDWIRVYNPSTTERRVKKLRMCYRGLYRVTKVISETIYRVQKIGGRQGLAVHYNSLKDASQEKAAA